MDRLLRALSHLTWRKPEAPPRDLMEAPFPSHGSLARHAARRLDPRLLEALLERLSREPEARLSSRGIPEVCAFSSRFTGPFSP
jgi:hypothetical protein